MAAPEHLDLTRIGGHSIEWSGEMTEPMTGILTGESTASGSPRA
jgi:hypothetical protein